MAFEALQRGKPNRTRSVIMRALILLVARLIGRSAPAIAAEGVPWEVLYTLQLRPGGSVKITGCILSKAGAAV